MSIIDPGKTVRRAENIEDLINAIRRLHERPFTENEFGEALLRAKIQRKRQKNAKTRSIGKSTLSDYFWLARESGLIRRTDGFEEVPALVVESIVGKPEHVVKKYLAELLATKLPAVQEFVKFLQEKPRTEKELKEKFNPQTTGVIIAWLEYCEAVQQSSEGKYYWTLTPESQMTTEDFWTKLQRAYESLRNTQLVGVKAVYVKIPDLREAFCTSYPMSRKSFDDHLARLRSGWRFRQKIEVTGAPISFIDDEQHLKRKRGIPFTYEGRVFYFIAIRP